MSEAHALQSLFHRLEGRFLQCVVASQAHLADPAIFWTLSQPFALRPWSHSQLPVLVASWIRSYLVAICEESSPAGKRGMIKCFSKVQTGTCKKVYIKKCCHIFTIIHPWLWLVSAFVARLANLKHPGSRHKSSMYRLQCPNSDLQKWTWLVHQFDSIKFKASNKSNSRSICIPVAIPVLWCLEWNWSRAYKDFVVHNLLLVLK